MFRDIVAFLCVTVLIGGAVSDPLYYYQSALTGHDDDDQSAALEEALSFSHDGGGDRQQRETNKPGDASSVLKALLNNVDQDSMVFKVVFDEDSGGFSLVFEPKGKVDAPGATVNEPQSLGSFAELKKKLPRNTLEEPRDTSYWQKRDQRAPKANKSPTRSRNENIRSEIVSPVRPASPRTKVEESSEPSSTTTTTEPTVNPPLMTATDSSSTEGDSQRQQQQERQLNRDADEPNTELPEIWPPHAKHPTPLSSTAANFNHKQWPLLLFNAFLTLLITRW